MKKIILTIATMALIASGCNRKTELTSGINLENLDTTASLNDDFYQYACGGWMAAHPLDAEQPETAPRYHQHRHLGTERTWFYRRQNRYPLQHRYGQRTSAGTGL